MADMDFKKKNGSKETGGTEEYNTSSNEDQEKWSKAKSNSWSFYLPLFACLSLDVLVFYFYREGNF